MVSDRADRLCRSPPESPSEPLGPHLAGVAFGPDREGPPRTVLTPLCLMGKTQQRYVQVRGAGQASLVSTSALAAPEPVVGRPAGGRAPLDRHGENMSVPLLILGSRSCPTHRNRSMTAGKTKARSRPSGVWVLTPVVLIRRVERRTSQGSQDRQPSRQQDPEQEKPCPHRVAQKGLHGPARLRS